MDARHKAGHDENGGSTLDENALALLKARPHITRMTSRSIFLAALLGMAVLAPGSLFWAPLAEAHFCPGPGPRLLHDPWREERPFALRDRCPEPPRAADRPAQPVRPAAPSAPN